MSEFPLAFSSATRPMDKIAVLLFLLFLREIQDMGLLPMICFNPCGVKPQTNFPLNLFMGGKETGKKQAERK